MLSRPSVYQLNAEVSEMADTTQTAEHYFPWHRFQLWLREGFRAGSILNKVMIASWPPDRHPGGQQPRSDPEELELLDSVLGRTQDEQERTIIQRLLSNLKSTEAYPPLNDEEARTLWLALSHYGTTTERYTTLHTHLKPYLMSLNDPDTMTKQWMDCLWRSIGPAMDPDRKEIENSI